MLKTSDLEMHSLHFNCCSSQKEPDYRFQASAEKKVRHEGTGSSFISMTRERSQKKCRNVSSQGESTMKTVGLLLRTVVNRLERLLGPTGGFKQKLFGFDSR